MRRSTFLFLAALAAHAHAQSPPPSAPLPDASALPQAPATRLPGPDHRECGPTKWSALCAAGRWLSFSRIDLRVTAPGFTARYDLEQAENGEMHATYREEAGKEAHAGEVVVFGLDGLAYRSRDTFPDTSAIIDYTLSTPILMSQLSALLLDLGVLGPPSEVGASRGVAASSQTQYIRTSAPRRALLYGAPWNMTGNVRSGGPDKVTFSLKLRFRPVDKYGNAVPNKSDTLTLDGTASFAPRRATLPDTMDLTGWRVMRVGEDNERPRVATLDEARRALSP